MNNNCLYISAQYFGFSGLTLMHVLSLNVMEHCTYNHILIPKSYLTVSNSFSTGRKRSMYVLLGIFFHIYVFHNTKCVSAYKIFICDITIHLKVANTYISGCKQGFWPYTHNLSTEYALFTCRGDLNARMT